MKPSGSRDANRPSHTLREIIPALVLAGTLCLTPGCEDGGSSHDFGANDPNLVVCAGDSITAGGYPGILAGMVGKTVIDSGRGGHTSAAGVGVVSRLLARYQPGYVIILYGANDLIVGNGVEGAAANLRAMIQAVKANQSIAIIGTLTPMYDNHGIWNGQVNALNERIRQIASEEGARRADLNRAFGSNRSYVGADGLHPTAEGNGVIAATFADRI